MVFYSVMDCLCKLKKTFWDMFPVLYEYEWVNGILLKIAYVEKLAGKKADTQTLLEVTLKIVSIVSVKYVTFELH